MPKLQSLSLHLALFIIMISGPLMGAWHAPVIFGLMLLSLFALGLHVLYKVRTGHELQTNWLIALPAISVLFTLSMLLPVPTGLHALLSPSSSTDLQHAYRLLGHSPVALFLSLDPRETALRFMQLLTALALFMVISDQIKHAQARKTSEFWILGGTLIFLLTALDHEPLANHNHTARIFGIFSLLCAAIFQESKPSWKRGAFCVAAVLSGAAVYTTLSRWGMISFTICLVIFLKSWRLALGILGTAVLTSSAIIWTRLATLTDSTSYWGKIELFKVVPAILQQHWLTGIGQGSLPIEYHKTILPDYNANPLFSIAYAISHLENTTLQTLVDHGVFKGLILCGLAIWTFKWVQKTKPNLAPILLFVWIGDFSDFAFESGTVLYLCTLVLALCPIDLKLKLSPQKFGAISVSSLLLVALSTWIVFVKSPVNYLNPTYAYPHHTQAWYEYALTRRPTYYPARVMLARLYWNQHQYPQALLEYKQAVASKPDSLATLLQEIAPIAPSLHDRKQILPIINSSTLSILCEQMPSVECFEEARDWPRVIQLALREQRPDIAMTALEAFTHGKEPDGQAAAWFAQILTLQNGQEETLLNTADWGRHLKDPCPFLTWRLEHLAPHQALRELGSIKECLDNWELKKADLYEQNGQPAKALEVILSLIKADPDNTTLAARKTNLSKSIKISQ